MQRDCGPPFFCARAQEISRIFRMPRAVQPPEFTGLKKTFQNLLHFRRERKNISEPKFLRKKSAARSLLRKNFSGQTQELKGAQFALTARRGSQGFPSHTLVICKTHNSACALRTRTHTLKPPTQKLKSTQKTARKLTDAHSRARQFFGHRRNKQKAQHTRSCAQKSYRRIHSFQRLENFSESSLLKTRGAIRVFDGLGTASE